MSKRRIPLPRAVLHRRAIDFFRMVICAAGVLTAGASMAATCQALNMPKLIFSSYDPTSNHPVDIDTTIDFYCEPAFKNRQLNIRVFLQGAGQGPMFAMKNSRGDTIRFGIFYDPARSLPLSSDMPLLVREVNPDTKTFRVTLYGRIFSRQKNAGTGAYQSKISLLLDY